MLNLLSVAIDWNNLYFDLAIAAILLLYFLFGLAKGFVKPITCIISWGIIILAFYFAANPLNNLLTSEQVGLDSILSGALGNVISDTALVDKIVKYLILAIIGVALIIVVKLIFAIINLITKRMRRAYRKSGLDRFMGGLLNLVKGALVVCVLMAIIAPLSELLAAQFNFPDLKTMIDNSYVTKYIVEYNPITMLINAISK